MISRECAKSREVALPESGIFVSCHQIVLISRVSRAESRPQSLNRYAYVSNNPLTQTDTSGLCGDDDPDCGGDPCLIYFCGAGPCDTCPIWSGPSLPNPAPSPAEPPVIHSTVGCESSGIPCGMQFPLGGGIGGCTYGSGNCGGIIFADQDVQSGQGGSSNWLSYVLGVIGLANWSKPNRAPPPVRGAPPICERIWYEPSFVPAASVIFSRPKPNSTLP